MFSEEIKLDGLTSGTELVKEFVLSTNKIYRVLRKRLIKGYSYAINYLTLREKSFRHLILKRDPDK